MLGKCSMVAIVIFILGFVTSVCKEFEHIKQRALREPETSEDLMDMVAFIETARTIDMIRLNEKIKVGRVECLPALPVITDQQTLKFYQNYNVS